MALAVQGDGAFHPNPEHSMTRQWLKAVTTLAVVLLASGQAWAEGSRLQSYLPRVETPRAATNSCQDPKSELAEVAAAAGYPINPEETVFASNADITTVASSIAGFESVPASGFIKGVDMGFMYLDAPGSGIPAGYYRLNTQAAAEDIHEGEYGGTVRLIDLNGNVAGELSARIQTFSLEVPKEPPFPRTTVSAMMVPYSGPRWHYTRTTYVYYCPNGSIIIFDVISVGYY